MLEVFLRASGAWRGKAMELYRRDRLPAEQARFASSLGNQRNASMNGVSADPVFQITENSRASKLALGSEPRNLVGPVGSGGGPTGLNRDPPPSKLELVRLRRGSKKLTPEFNGSQNYQPKEEWGEATVWASFKDGPQDVLNWPGRRMSTPNESLLCTPQLTCIQVALPRDSYNSNYAYSQEDDCVRCAPGTSTVN